MANSVFQDPRGIDWPLGFVAVATSGTPVSIMHNVDPNGTMAPGTPAGPANPGTDEYTPRCHKIWFQGYKPSAGGMISNTGAVYVMRSPGPQNNFPTGGTGNRSDPGAMVAIVPPGQSITIPAMEGEAETISPYRYSLDADTAGEGALVTLLSCGR